MFSYFDLNFIEKFLWESGFSNFGQNRNEAKLKISYLKRYNIFKMLKVKNSKVFSGIIVFDSAYIYGENFIAKFRWKSGFLGGFQGTPLGNNGSKSTLVT